MPVAHVVSPRPFALCARSSQAMASRGTRCSRFLNCRRRSQPAARGTRKMDAEQNNATVAVLQWWRALHLDIGAARAARARLRRCSGALDALLLEETHDLIKAARSAEPGSAVRDV